MRQDKRRFVLRVAAKTLPGLVTEVNRAFAHIEQHISQTDAVGQAPDMKGKGLINVGNLKAIDSLSPSATLADVIDKINEVLDAFNT